MTFSFSGHCSVDNSAWLSCLGAVPGDGASFVLQPGLNFAQITRLCLEKCSSALAIDRFIVFKEVVFCSSYWYLAGNGWDWGLR